MNITKILTGKIRRRMGELGHADIAKRVVPGLVEAEGPTVKAAIEEAEEAARLAVAKALEKAQAEAKAAVKEAEEAGRLLVAKTLERALTRASTRITPKRISRVLVATFKAGVTAVTSKKTDGKAARGQGRSPSVTSQVTASASVS